MRGGNKPSWLRRPKIRKPQYSLLYIIIDVLLYRHVYCLSRGILRKVPTLCLSGILSEILLDQVKHPIYFFSDELLIVLHESHYYSQKQENRVAGSVLDSRHDTLLCKPPPPSITCFPQEEKSPSEYKSSVELFPNLSEWHWLRRHHHRLARSSPEFSTHC